jgi:hypothetical protein
VNVIWSRVAPVRPSIPDDPSSAGYDWTAVDSAVKDLHARGLDVMLMLYDAPGWAEAPGRPSAVSPGSWRPDPKAFGQFATAAAIRYDGHTPEPGHLFTFLPRVRYWQAWNEPNLDQYLSPQRVKAAHGERTVGPALYRPLLNALYASVKRVASSNYVVAGGTTSYGNANKPLGKQATAPVVFYRGLFCLKGPALKPASGCPAVDLDAVDHHPYKAQGPASHAVGRDEVAVPDIYKISRVLRAAEASGHAAPRGNKSIWVSELAWSSNPPAPNGVPMTVDAHWYELAFYTLYRQGVRTIMPLELGDPGLFPGQPQVLQSGLYFHNGKAKPLALAYRFPFVIASQGADQVLAWGRSPRAGRLAIEVHTRQHGWQVLRRLTVGRWQVFQTSIPHHGMSTWRAVVGPAVSLNWRQGAYTRR